MKELREARINRNTLETQIELELRIDGNGASEIRTDCGFLNHMLTLFAKHGNFDLKISCAGDTAVDFHHTVEDIGICLGKAFAVAAGEFRGVKRYAARYSADGRGLDFMCGGFIREEAILHTSFRSSLRESGRLIRSWRGSSCWHLCGIFRLRCISGRFQE